MIAHHGTSADRLPSIKARGLIGPTFVTTDEREARRYAEATTAGAYHAGRPPVGLVVTVDVDEDELQPDFTGIERDAFLTADGVPGDGIVGYRTIDYGWSKTWPSLALAMATVRFSALEAARRRNITSWTPTSERRVSDAELIAAARDVLTRR